MLKIFLATHGHMASGIKSSLDILLGNTNRLSHFDAYVDEQNVQEKLDEFYASVSAQDEVILLSDLYGGSVNSVMFTYLEKPNTRLIAGVNLPLVLELMLKESISDTELEHLVSSSREMLRIVRLDSEEASTDDFF